MFPLQRSCELSFQVSEDKDDGQQYSDPNPLQYLFLSDFPHPKLLGTCTESLNPIPIPIIGDNSTAGELGRSCRRRRRSSNHAGEMDSKRIVHRETERQRRLEMASHYTSLRDLLPNTYVKGKRSMSDHIIEAANYIKDLERSIKEMESKREKLKTAGDSHVVSVERCSQSQGLEINISCGSDDQLPLSRVLTVLMEEGLDVVKCLSTKVRRRIIHVIHAEMKDMLSIDPSLLQRRLINELCSYER